jgi:hypothetical protein
VRFEDVSINGTSRARPDAGIFGRLQRAKANGLRRRNSGQKR